MKSNVVKRKPGPATTGNGGWDESASNELDIENTNSTDNFTFSHYGITSEEARILLANYGLNALPEKKVSKLYIFFSLLWEPMPIMIWIAIIIEAVIAKWMDFGVLLGTVSSTSLYFSN